MHLVPLVLLLFLITPNYREAVPGYRLSFPRDHFEHPEFRTEWWYYTGNVWSRDGHRFGFELVFFREGDAIGPRDNPSAWRVHDVYLAHAALTDIDGKRYMSRERLNRSGPGIAGASFEKQRIWNGNWSDAWHGDDQTLTAVTDDFTFRLECHPSKPLVLQGDRGLSQKAEGLGHASYYVSFPRLSVTGKLHTADRDYEVAGQAWMDHEWFTHQLQTGQIGWDWFSVQLDDNTELMLFDLRRKDGSVDPYSSGTFVAPDGSTRHLTKADFTLKPIDRWKSAKTGAEYPIAWTIDVPSLKLHLTCRAALQDQELAGSLRARYWEGAVDYNGTRHGVGYLEMTGYDGPVKME